MRRFLLVISFGLVPSMTNAQSGPAIQLARDWQRNRHNVLAYIEAMPDSALAFRPTPGVRTLAEQVDHIVSTNLDVATVVRGAERPPTLGDPAQYLHSKSALRAYAEATYAYVLATIDGATPAELERTISVYGAPPGPAAGYLELSLEHSIWTLGQLVPYLRLNGVTPPAYDIPL
jgi:uncharacterized damage-inducible protein DinB